MKIRQGLVSCTIPAPPQWLAQYRCGDETYHCGKNHSCHTKVCKRRRGAGQGPPHFLPLPLLSLSPQEQLPPLALLTRNCTLAQGCPFLGLILTLAGSTRASECSWEEGMVVAATLGFLALNRSKLGHGRGLDTGP